MAKKKILIIEDETQMANMLKLRLEANGYEAITACDGEDGFKKAETQNPDLILLDIMMPNKDGFTFVREAKGNESMRQIPIVVLTAKPGMKDLFAMEGIKDYLVKPFEDKELLEKIKERIG